LSLSQLELPLPEPRAVRTAEGESVRAVQLGKRVVTYRFRRAARRTIGISVGREGLVAAAPRWVTIAEVEAFIREKERWVFAKLLESASATRARVDWMSGGVLPIFGRDIQLESAPHAGDVHVDDDRLYVPATHSTGEAMRAAVVGWMKRVGLVLYRQRAAVLAPRLSVITPEVRISNAATQWGHCTIDRTGRARVYLHWRLLHFPERLIDYVVVHELAHIREMNHSPRFWKLVASLVPDYPGARKEIHRLARALPEL
jgi:hypothetical protein